MGLPALSGAQPACPPDGDVDRNGSVTAADALLAFQQALGLARLTACQRTIADVFPQPFDPDGAITASDALCIFQEALNLPSCLDILPPANQPPVADAGVDQSVDGGTIVLLSGTTSDPDGTIASYLWEQTAGTTVALAGAATATATFTAPDVPAEETLAFLLIVTDDEGATASDVVRVTVRAVNQPPVADAGVDQSVDGGTIVLLSGTTSDPDGTIASYLWEQTAGTTVALAGAATATATFKAPDVPAEETLAFLLIVTDDEGATASDVVMVTVRAVNQPPVVSAGADQTIDEGVVVTLAGEASDPDGRIISYLWEQTAGTRVALAGAASAAATFIAPDVPADAILTFRLTVTDNDGASATDTVSVTVSATVSAFPGDLFSSSVAIGGEAGRSEKSNIGAGLEDREPKHAGNSGGASVWWTWTAPQTGIYEFDTRGSDFDTLLAIYTGDNLERLAEVVSNDDIERRRNRQSAVRFSAQQDHVYHIAVDGYGGETGAVVLNWRLPSVPRSVTQFDDNVVVITISGSLTTDPLDFRELAQAFYGKYEDAFDFLVFISNTPDRSLNETLPYRGAYYGIHLKIRNAVDGIGRPVDTFRQIESTDHLKFVLHLNYYNALEYGPSLHEIMHEWANFVVPTASRSHWGFSSANGQLGGFDLADLVEHSPGKYSAGRFGAVANGGNSVPYSPIELYLAGFIPPSEVPDLWVAKDGAWTDETDESGNRIFTASDIESYSIERIVSENGVRDPDFRESQKHFSAAAILLVDDMYPATKEALEELSASVRRFAHPGSDKQFLFNFWEATGGRATLTMDELVQRPVGAAPLVSSEVSRH